MTVIQRIPVNEGETGNVENSLIVQPVQKVKVKTEKINLKVFDNLIIPLNFPCKKLEQYDRVELFMAALTWLVITKKQPFLSDKDAHEKARAIFTRIEKVAAGRNVGSWNYETNKMNFPNYSEFNKIEGGIIYDKKIQHHIIIGYNGAVELHKPITENSEQYFVFFLVPGNDKQFVTQNNIN